MKATFGNTFKLVVPPRRGLVFWRGVVEINMRMSRFSSFQSEHTLGYCLSQRNIQIVQQKHIVASRKFIVKSINMKMGSCVCSTQKMVSNMVGTPANRRAVTVTGWAVQWLYAYYTWRSTGQWPGIEERIRPDSPLPRPRGRRRR